jgi:beta-galactosidase
LDRLDTPLGIRWVVFDKEQGFFLNGHHLKLIGANVHQTWPFIGNAVPNGLHRRDAEQMKAMTVSAR